MTKQDEKISSSGLQEIHLVISATYTIDYLLPSLNAVLDYLSLSSQITLTPYHQVFQQLLDSSSLSAQNQNGINIIFLRVEDFARDYSESTGIIEHVEKIALDLESAFVQFSSRTNAPTLLAILPCSPRFTGDLKIAFNRITANLLKSIEHLPSLIIVSETDFASVNLDLDLGYDKDSDDLAHVPYSESIYSALALVIARKIHMLRVPAKKVLVLDCDNTIWRGVVGEDGVDGITFPESFIQIQQFAIEVQSRGILICLASKNAEQDVLEVFEKRTEMPLKLEHIVAHRINWEPKYQNLQSLANELNLGIDSFVFLDDNPVECGQMRDAQPKVTTLQVPPDAEVLSFLKNLWVFDKLSITEEDAKRTQMYRENNARQKLEESTTDIAGFLASLELVIDIAPPDEEEWPRVAQLTQRTNQFNFTTIRRNETELRALAQSSDTAVLRVKVRDRFGDYGLVGIVIARIQDALLSIDTLLLSCRVLGRGVEHAMLRHAGELAKSKNCLYVDLPYFLTPKNEPARAFADHIAVAYKIEENAAVTYHVPVEFAIQISHVPGGDPEAILEAKRADAKKKPSAEKSTADVASNTSERYETLATRLTNGEQLLAYSRHISERHRNLEAPTVAASTPTETKLLTIWEEVLGIKGLGVEDDYFALGGTSLLAARLFAEIAHQFGVRLRLTTILDAPTVKLLATYLSSNHVAGNSVLIDLRPHGQRTLFFVHDGDGETLLYRNLATRLPTEFSVVGIEPLSIPYVPMGHISIESMASFYIESLRKRQPHGPYILSGMCAGGLIAYVMGSQLMQLGEKVELVAILDAATPHAEKIAGLATEARKSRLTSMLKEVNESKSSAFIRTIRIINQFLIKLANYIKWEVSSRWQLIFRRLRFWVLKKVVSSKMQWPSWLKQLTVREIYDTAEFNCKLKSHPDFTVLLVRASKVDCEVGDIAYQYLYQDETFGWRKVVPNIIVEDVDGGHASMLQEPYVASLSGVFNKYLKQVDGNTK